MGGCPVSLDVRERVSLDDRRRGTHQIGGKRGTKRTFQAHHTASSYLSGAGLRNLPESPGRFQAHSPRPGSYLRVQGRFHSKGGGLMADEEEPKVKKEFPLTIIGRCYACEKVIECVILHPEHRVVSFKEQCFACPKLGKVSCSKYLYEQKIEMPCLCSGCSLAGKS